MGGNEDPTQVWDKVTNPRKIVAKTDEKVRQEFLSLIK